MRAVSPVRTEWAQRLVVLVVPTEKRKAGLNSLRGASGPETLPIRYPSTREASALTVALGHVVVYLWVCDCGKAL
jgi:hypothetical protein